MKTEISREQKGIYRSPYLTRKSGFIDDLKSEVHKALVLDKEQEIIKVEGNLLIIKTGLEDIHQFSHPVYDNDNDHVIIDGRPFTTRDGDLRRSDDLRGLMQRGYLEHSYLNNTDMFHYHDGLLVDVFANWTSRTIVPRANLDDVTVTTLKVVMGCYYLTRVFEESAPEDFEDYTTWLIQKITNILRIPPPIVIGIVESEENNIIKEDRSLSAFLHFFRELSGTDVLTEDLLISGLINGAFLGANASEIVAVSLNHVPTFAFIVLYGLTNRSYASKTTIGRIVKSVGRKHNHKSFENLMHQAYVDENTL